MQPFFGYPGGKSRAYQRIVKTLNLDLRKYTRIVEPFCGGGSFSLQSEHPQIWLNDIDADLFCLWESVVKYPDDFCRAIENVKIYVDDFYRLQNKLLEKHSIPKDKKSIVNRALDKLIVHKISFSNMGEKSGSPVGGKNQTGKWKFDCRWNVKGICKNIRKASKILENAAITCLPYEKVFSDAKDSDLFFIDPPYFGSGKKCYKHSSMDHIDLSSCVKKLPCDWAVTYDTHEKVLEMYDWANVYDLEFNYFMSSAYNKGKCMKTGKELLVTNLEV